MKTKLNICTTGSTLEARIRHPLFSSSEALLSSLLVLLVLVASSASSAPGNWSQGPDIPAPAQTCASCVLDGKLYVLGGHDDKAGNHALSNVWRFDPPSDSWTNRAPLPKPRHFIGQCAVALDGMIYLIGGSGSGVPGTLIREVAAYNPTTDTWTNGALMPTGRGNLAACAVDGIIYAIAGTSSPGNQIATVEAYDPKSNQWTTKRSMPQARWFVTASVVNGIIYVFHGTDVFAYDPKTDTWTTKASHFSPYSWGLMSAEAGGIIYLFGGFTQDWSDGHDFTLAYDPVQDQFSARARMPRKRATAACGAIGGKIYLAGGASEEPLANPEAVYYTTLDIFNPQTLRYVDAASLNPTPPYSTWATAARLIQDAVDVAVAGDEIVVTNGLYATGGRAAGTNVLVNRVAVDKPLTLRSVNGPQVTIIQGYQVPVTTNGDGAIRCVYLASNASLTGFTLTNGGTRGGDYGAGDWERERSGGGGWCESTSAVVSNCIISGNSAEWDGGGVRGGKVNNCVLSRNSASFGGGALGSTLNNCVVKSNSSGGGGGIFESAANNCLVIDNSAAWGGGAVNSTMNNCTVIGNSAQLVGGVVQDSGPPTRLTNCIVYDNTATSIGDNYSPECQWSYSCTFPMPQGGLGNITNAPQFVDAAAGDYRLRSDSPCINAGNNACAFGLTDLDGWPRIVSGTVDIGAYEFQGPGSTISYAWLQQYGLPTDGSADAADLDWDGHTTWQEWHCLTNPTNELSALRLLSVTSDGTNVFVGWQSIAGVRYLLERSTDLSASPPFLTLAAGLEGWPGVTSFIDTNAAALAPRFYRVGVNAR